MVARDLVALDGSEVRAGEGGHDACAPEKSPVTLDSRRTFAEGWPTARARSTCTCQKTLDWRGSMLSGSMKSPRVEARTIEPNRQYDRAKERCVGVLDGVNVYFVGSRSSFHLAIESSPGVLRLLSETEHSRFRCQSRIEGINYK